MVCMPPTSINRANTVLEIDFKNVRFIFFPSKTLKFRSRVLLALRPTRVIIRDRYKKVFPFGLKFCEFF